jgi:hypothetical protein
MDYFTNIYMIAAIQHTMTTTTNNGNNGNNGDNYSNMPWNQWVDAECRNHASWPSWAQSVQEEEVGGGGGDYDGDSVDADAETHFPTTPKVKSRSSAQPVKRQLFKSPGKPAIQAIQAIQAQALAVKQVYEVPEKAKTRAEKRAPIREEELPVFITPQKSERRTEYWALQDDLRLKRARIFKELKCGQILVEEL